MANPGRSRGQKKPQAAPETAWPARSVEMRPIASLAAYDRNPRAHPPEQVAQIARSITEFGWTIPVLVDEAGVLIAGHGRVLAAQSLGIAEVPVMVASGWTEDQKAAYRIADNQLTIAGEWDDAALREEIERLTAADFDLDLLAFDDGFLEALRLEHEVDPGASASSERDPSAPGRVSLSDRFGIAPFTTFNAREGWWQARKAAWLALGIKSELGRGAPSFNDGASGMADQVAQAATKRRKANAIPGGSRQPAIDPKTGKIVRADSKGRPISGAKTDADVERAR